MNGTKGRNSVALPAKVALSFQGCRGLLKSTAGTGSNYQPKRKRDRHGSALQNVIIPCQLPHVHQVVFVSTTHYSPASQAVTEATDSGADWYVWVSKLYMFQSIFNPL